MPGTSDPNIWSVITSIIVVTVSGLLAVARRLTDGNQKFGWPWFLAQMGGSLLAGFIMYDTYPLLVREGFLPVYATQIIMLSLAAHYGGKVFTMSENFFKNKFPFLFKEGN